MASSRTDAIQRALVEALNRYRAMIDASPDLTTIRFDVKLQAGPDPVRAITYSDERVRRPWSKGEVGAV